MTSTKRDRHPGIWLDETERRSNLTRSQYLIWSGQRLWPTVPLYNMALAFELTGAADVSTLRRAFAAEVDTNDALRSVFTAEDGVPRQRVLPGGMPELTHVDLRGVGEPDEAARRWMHERTRRMFDVSVCAYDSALLTLGDRAHVWYLNQHHLITDGWSSARVHDRVLASYAAGGAALPPQPSFADYVMRERAAREEARSAKHRAFWHERSAASGARLGFYGAPARRTSAASERVALDPGPSRSAALVERARALGLLSVELGVFSVFATLLAAWSARVTHAERISIGVPVHHRSSGVDRETPGLYIELLPLVIDVDRERSLDDLLREVVAAGLDMLRHASPGISSPEMNRGCDLVLNVLNRPFASTGGFHAATEWIHPGAADADHQLRLQVHDFDARGTFGFLFDFNADVFGHAERTWAMEQFQRLLDAFLADPGRPLGRIDLRSDEERRAHAHFGDAGRAGRAGDSELVSLLDLGGCDPDRCAVEEDGRALSYGALDRLSGALAAELAGLGVARGSLVPIVIGRRTELVLAIVATLRAGAAYLPLNSAEPPHRLAATLEDAAGGEFRTGPLLAIEGVHIPAGAPFRRVNVSLEALASSDRRDPPAVSRAPADVAYLIYTSGSTGRPKGVVIEDRSLARYLSWARAQYTDGPTDSALHTSPAVDLSVTSIFLPLLSGGRIRIYPEGEAGAEVPILDVFRDDAVDLVKLTPSHLALLQQVGGRAERIRTLILGGEDLRSATVRGALERFGADARIFNEYGPTEATVGCMVHRFDPERDRWASVPIGRPIEGAIIHLLDAHGEPVPTGVEGEICIGGDGLARGYHDRPESTAAAFETFRTADGHRLYRSGDRGRWSGDGRLEFLGRLDDQGKIRGVRVEPGEIEAALARHPAVRSCAVVFHGAPIQERVDLCARCGIPSNHPDVHLDADGVCSLCTNFETLRTEALRYFKTREAFAAVVERMRADRRGDHDCLVLFSGGKDSTYMLHQLVEAGLRPITFTLDNGYISEEAKANIRRAVDDVGVEHVFATTPHMREIFADSLTRYSNVCDGCFKTIYTLAINLARKRKIGYIVTGLSRGQIFETRLHHLFRARVFDVPTIESRILDARKVYHRVDDAVARTLDVSCFADDAVFDDVEFIDFYRYWDVDLDVVYRFLADRASWVRPSDTGRSTNCLINDAGIFVHTRERGFHNYALPYSWDVRVGHKSRAGALEELNDEIDEDRVMEILREVGYTPKSDPVSRRDPRLVAYYVGEELETSAFREYLAPRLQPEMIPTEFVRLDEIPLTTAGKIDRDRLPSPGDAARRGHHVAPRSEVEERLAAIWREVLQREPIGVTDDFFELGGHSLPALQAIARIDDAFGVELPIATFFRAPTIEALAKLVEETVIDEIERMSDDEVDDSLAGDRS